MSHWEFKELFVGRPTPLGLPQNPCSYAMLFIVLVIKHFFLYPNPNSIKNIIFKGNTQNMPKLDHTALKSSHKSTSAYIRIYNKAKSVLRGNQCLHIYLSSPHDCKILFNLSYLLANSSKHFLKIKMTWINQQISHQNQMLICHSLVLGVIKRRQIMRTGVYIKSFPNN